MYSIYIYILLKYHKHKTWVYPPGNWLIFPLVKVAFAKMSFLFHRWYILEVPRLNFFKLLLLILQKSSDHNLGCISRGSNRGSRRPNQRMVGWWVDFGGAYPWFSSWEKLPVPQLVSLPEFERTINSIGGFWFWSQGFVHVYFPILHEELTLKSSKSQGIFVSFCVSSS